MATTPKALGRPRGFDADRALDQAVLVFWAQGYEGASLSDLTAAMGITRPSLYAAFGAKEDLFRAALGRYSAGPGAYGTRALEEPTAHGVATAFLHGAVDTTTGPDRPHGCLGVQGGLTTSPGDRAVRELLATWRNDACARLAERFRRAAAEGDLPAGSDPDLLAEVLMTVANGIAVQAAGGTGRERLRAVADAALRTWPPA
ncbi:TetR/AcrR family transcriptional regulator [Pseudokineococcus marinus]|uniref:TetR/AcrR family transcriptional regulator n=1 Tax=Pseudokineococcus marinus TaxID=351215 RepID=A0A849BME8_9ACTN|nr:TetR/AcrR family transcriptional regulator [Pseudokineococcus marinus]NNH22545.1 TetR/AcrR family transcriptional regulator [Pseudokineococcus marinus]